jgi:precorrin-6B methylase 2
MDQPREYLSYASLPWVKTVCEVGFAGGHSTVVYMTANPNVTIYSFDNFHKRGLTSTAYEMLRGNGHITLIEGDSTKTVPAFMEDHPDVYCDIISIDGAHHAKFPDTDLRNFK